MDDAAGERPAQRHERGEVAGGRGERGRLGSQLAASACANPGARVSSTAGESRRPGGQCAARLVRRAGSRPGRLAASASVALAASAARAAPSASTRRVVSPARRENVRAEPSHCRTVTVHASPFSVTSATCASGSTSRSRPRGATTRASGHRRTSAGVSSGWSGVATEPVKRCGAPSPATRRAAARSGGQVRRSAVTSPSFSAPSRDSTSSAPPTPSRTLHSSQPTLCTSASGTASAGRPSGKSERVAAVSSQLAASCSPPCSRRQLLVIARAFRRTRGRTWRPPRPWRRSAGIRSWRRSWRRTRSRTCRASSRRRRTGRGRPPRQPRPRPR